MCYDGYFNFKTVIWKLGHSKKKKKKKKEKIIEDKHILGTIAGTEPRYKIYDNIVI
jgi:hypothetical protein